MRPKDDLHGARIVVTAGGTSEPVDPVRYIGNRSTGKQGFALAEAASERGAFRHAHLDGPYSDRSSIRGRLSSPSIACSFER